MDLNHPQNLDEERMLAICQIKALDKIFGKSTRRIASLYDIDTGDREYRFHQESDAVDGICDLEYREFKYTERVQYVGYTKVGEYLPHGEGVLFVFNDSYQVHIFTGTFKDGLLHGHGNVQIISSRSKVSDESATDNCHNHRILYAEFKDGYPYQTALYYSMQFGKYSCSTYTGPGQLITPMAHIYTDGVAYEHETIVCAVNPHKRDRHYMKIDWDEIAGYDIMGSSYWGRYVEPIICYDYITLNGKKIIIRVDHGKAYVRYDINGHTIESYNPTTADISVEVGNSKYIIPRPPFNGKHSCDVKMEQVKYEFDIVFKDDVIIEATWVKTAPRFVGRYVLGQSEYQKTTPGDTVTEPDTAPLSADDIFKMIDKGHPVP